MVLSDLLRRWSKVSLAGITFVLIASGNVSAQLHSFDLDNIPAAEFEDQVTAVFKNIGLSLGYHPLFSSSPQRRLKTGFSLSYPGSGSGDGGQRGFIPLLEAGFLVTSNLVLTGKISGFGARDDVVQITSYGGVLFLENEDREPWVFNISLSYLNGPEDMFIRSSDILLRRLYHPLKIPVHVGLGANLYSGRANYNPDTSLNRRFKGQTNYLYAGGSIPLWFPGTVDIQLHFHPQHFMIALGIVREFK